MMQNLSDEEEAGLYAELTAASDPEAEKRIREAVTARVKAEQITAAEPVRRRFGIRRSWMTAAAAVLVMTGAVTMLAVFRNRPEPPPIPPEQSRTESEPAVTGQDESVPGTDVTQPPQTESGTDSASAGTPSAGQTTQTVTETQITVSETDPSGSPDSGTQPSSATGSGSSGGNGGAGHTESIRPEVTGTQTQPTSYSSSSFEGPPQEVTTDQGIEIITDTEVTAFETTRLCETEYLCETTTETTTEQTAS